MTDIDIIREALEDTAAHCHSDCGDIKKSAEAALSALERVSARLAELERAQEDTCGLCGRPGADKIPHPVHWPGERVPDSELVHSDCESEECARAHAALSDAQRESFLRSL